MSFSPHLGMQHSFPTVRVGSGANSMPTGSYGNHSSPCQLGSGTLLRPHHSGCSSRSPPMSGKKSAKRAAVMTSISAIDTASTKLSIPITAVEPTLAFEDDGLVPGLCRLYLEGRCRQADRCFQVHANPSVVEQLRQEAFNKPSCCPVHGAKCSFEGLPLGLAIIIDPPREKDSAAMGETHVEVESGSATGSPFDGEATTASTGGTLSSGPNANSAQQNAAIALHYICPTRFLWSRYEENVGMLLHIPKSKICREHRKGLCRFGNECSFLHLCRQIPLTGGEDDSASHNRTQLRHTSTQGSMPDYAPNAPSFATGNVCVYPQAHSQSNSQANVHHLPGSIFASQSGSYVGSSFGNSQANSRQHLSRPPGTSGSSGGDPQPLLRPLGGARNSHSSLTGRGSFSHNPYAEASSFQG
ncbi:hypothetical protein JKF63_04347 [Porcisia hertigi]|uniref:C3H1-type domain-containing protein n=1 Tax=Porcisia hertigi TaxID=2761500 RepID=A0A836I5A3_9TRYP|nr:hypothetical protein JKF63_04347 [Porcisia hertigi]